MPPVTRADLNVETVAGDCPLTLQCNNLIADAYHL